MKAPYTMRDILHGSTRMSIAERKQALESVTQKQIEEAGKGGK